MTKLFNVIFLVLISAFSYSQNTITGNFPNLAGQKLRLVGFNGFGIYTIDTTIISDEGFFQVSYGKEDAGMGYLAAEDNKAFFVVLDKEDLHLKGELLAFAESVEILSGEQNKLFAQYAREHPKREQTLTAWIYLRNIYEADVLFASQQIPKKAIEAEIYRIKAEDSMFLESLDKQSYLSWYLPTRKLISSVSTVAQFRTDEIPSTIAAFRALDHTDHRLYKSGLFRNTIESHFWLLENSGRSLDSVFVEMKISIDHLIENLISDEKKLNEITDYLFDLLERHSLFEASEHLALTLLNETTCTLNDDFARQLETYRAMKKGNIAADIVFAANTFTLGYVQDNAPRKLSDIDTEYTVVVFGASWCPHCIEELQAIAHNYPNWKEQGVEVLFVSLDEDKTTFQSFAGIFPFISTCDYGKWNSKPVLDYYVFATPTMFLLDKKREILLRPNSVRQMDAWVNYYLVEKNR